MNPPTNATPAPVTLAGPAALRELARAFTHITDFRRFVEMLEAVLGKAAFFAEARVQLLPDGPEPAVFTPGKITVPLNIGERFQGVLRLAGAPDHPFGPGDLHLMSALASVLAAAMDHARRHGELMRNLEVLELLLNLAPVGLLLADTDGRPQLANDTARRWLGVADARAAGEAFTAAAPEGGWLRAGRFHLRAGGRLLYAEVANCRPAEGGGAFAVVLTDLSPEQGRLIDGLQRELYRCRWKGTPLAFVLLESSQPGALCPQLPALRAEYRTGEFDGPYDAHRVAVVLPEVPLGEARDRLRGWARHFAALDLRASVVASDTDRAEEVLSDALGDLRPVESVLRRSLLLYDDYPAVNDMLAMVLRRHFDVVKSSNIEEAKALLRERRFDGLVTEVELRAGGSGLDLARMARELQPGIRPFFTTVTHEQESLTDDPLLADHRVITKPFDVRRLEAIMREALP